MCSERIRSGRFTSKARHSCLSLAKLMGNESRRRNVVFFQKFIMKGLACSDKFLPGVISVTAGW